MRHNETSRAYGLRTNEKRNDRGGEGSLGFHTFGDWLNGESVAEVCQAKYGGKVLRHKRFLSKGERSHSLAGRVVARAISVARLKMSAFAKLRRDSLRSPLRRERRLEVRGLSKASLWLRL